MKKSALAYLFLLLIWVHPLFASEPVPYFRNGPDSQTDPATRQAVSNLAKGCLIEETAILDLSEDNNRRQASLTGMAYAGVRDVTAARVASEENTGAMATGAWLMGAGLVVFVISRKRFRG